MGFRHAAVLSATSFFLGEFYLYLQQSYIQVVSIGVLFISFNVDRRILYGGVRPSEEDYADAFKFYTTFFEAPLAIKVFVSLLYSILSLSNAFVSVGTVTCSYGYRSLGTCRKAA